MKITNKTVIGTKNAVVEPYLEFQLQNVRFLQIYCDFFPCNGFCGGVHTKGNEPICKKKKEKNLLTEGSVIKRLVRKEKHAQLLLSAKSGYCCRWSFIREQTPTVWEFKNFSCHSDFTWNRILAYFDSKKLLLLTVSVRSILC